MGPDFDARFTTFLVVCASILLGLIALVVLGVIAIGRMVARPPRDSRGFEIKPFTGTTARNETKKDDPHG